MKSIKSKFLTISVSAMLLLAIFLISVSVALVTTISNRDASNLMNQICDSNAEKFNSEIGMIAQTVDILSMTILDDIDAMAHLYDSEYAKDYVDRVLENTIAIANNTPGAKAVYFRLNPKVSGSGMDGFFWSRKSDDEDFTEEEPTDILAYDKDDIEHVGWYYIPIQKGHSTWMTPYYNKNIDVYMISYVVPCYLDGTMVGVLGMDIDFMKILEKTSGASVYQTSQVKLASIQDDTLYYLSNDEVVTSLLDSSMKESILNDTMESDIHKYEQNNVKWYFSYKTLLNDMKVIIYVPQADINYERNNLLKNMALIVLFVFLIIFVSIILFTERLIAPLRALTEATEKYTKDSEDFEPIEIKSDDEIGRLAKSYMAMINTIHSNMEEINSHARTDALTGLGNKSYYLETIKNVKDNQNSAWDKYAVVVYDLNFLKKTNDIYGHEMGDALIKEAGNYISDIYKESQTFRLGGDEFITLVTGNDYENRKELEAKFKAGLVNNVFDAEKNIMLSIASGMATYEEDGKNYDELFRVADSKMYENKKAQKAVRID